MKFGCCLSIHHELFPRLAELGADYGEAGFSALEDMSLSQCRQRAAQLKSAGVPLPVMNVLIPGRLRLTGPEVDYPALDRYLDQGLEKAALFGVELLVLGSGAARMVPHGFSKEEAFRQMAFFCGEHLAPRLEQRSMACCIEPLNQGECNLLNTCREGFALVREVDRPSIRLLVDLYHFDLEGEARSSLLDYGPALAHAHIASAKNHRRPPLPGDGEDYGSSSPPSESLATRAGCPWKATSPAAESRSRLPWPICDRCYKENLPNRGGFLICSNLF